MLKKPEYQTVDLPYKLVYPQLKPKSGTPASSICKKVCQCLDYNAMPFGICNGCGLFGPWTLADRRMMYEMQSGL